jgi:hypothetical protein
LNFTHGVHLSVVFPIPRLQLAAVTLLEQMQ